MSKMNDMAMTIEELRNAATAINDVANWLAQQFSSDDKPVSYTHLDQSPTSVT